MRPEQNDREGAYIAVFFLSFNYKLHAQIK